MNAATTEQQDGCGDAISIAKNMVIREPKNVIMVLIRAVVDLDTIIFSAGPVGLSAGRMKYS